MQPWGMHINFCSPHILQAGRIQLAKVWHAKDWHILSDLWNLPNLSNCSSAKTTAPIGLILPWHLSSTGLGWRPKNAERHFLCTLLRLSRCWSCCVCLSTFTLKCKVDMLCNQSRSANWFIKEKKKINRKTTRTKQVVLDTKWGTLHFLVFAFVLSWNAMRFP